MITQYDIDMVDYFIREKGDIERWSSWPERKQEILAVFPELDFALNNLKMAEISLDAVINKMIDARYDN